MGSYACLIRDGDSTSGEHSCVRAYMYACVQGCVAQRKGEDAGLLWIRCGARLLY